MARDRQRNQRTVLSRNRARAEQDGGLLGDIVIAYETLERECDEEKRVFSIIFPTSPCTVFSISLATITRRDAQAEEMEELESKS